MQNIPRQNISKPRKPSGISRPDRIRLLLGIETSCDETAAAVLEARNGQVRILSSVISSQIALHAKTGGVVPEVAARAHTTQIIPVIRQSLDEAKTRLEKIDAIAVTAGPGLLTSLMVGVETARTMALALNRPLIAVNHIAAHAFSALLENAKFDAKQFRKFFPALALVVSGGHTDLILIKNQSRYRKIGRTIDDAAGECFDKTARLLDLPYPGGPALSKLASEGRETIAFPRPMLKSEDFNFSFSGLKTAVMYYLRDSSRTASYTSGSAQIPASNKAADKSAAGFGEETGESSGRQKTPKNNIIKSNIAASVQAAIVDVLTEKTIAAAKKYRVKNIFLGGGVAANQALRIKLQLEAERLPAELHIAETRYCTDNAAMIAFAGWLQAQSQGFSPLHKVRADAGWEID